jgi:hypothetical protein
MRTHSRYPGVPDRLTGVPARARGAEPFKGRVRGPAGPRPGGERPTARGGDYQGVGPKAASLGGSVATRGEHERRGGKKRTDTPRHTGARPAARDTTPGAQCGLSAGPGGGPVWRTDRGQGGTRELARYMGCARGRAHKTQGTGPRKHERERGVSGVSKRVCNGGV